jgi:hypothetical protein
MCADILVAVRPGPDESRLLVHECQCGDVHVFPLSAGVVYKDAMLTHFLHDLRFDTPCDRYPEGVYLVPEGSASPLRQQPKARFCQHGHPMTFKRFKSIPKGMWYCRECHRVAAEKRRRVAGKTVAGSPEHKDAISAGQRHRWQNPEHVVPPHLKAGASKGYKWTPDQKARMREAAGLREDLKRRGRDCASCGKRFLPTSSKA